MTAVCILLSLFATDSLFVEKVRQLNFLLLDSRFPVILVNSGVTHIAAHIHFRYAYIGNRKGVALTVFALSNGKLVGAPTYTQTTPEVTEKVLNAIRDEAINLIDRPLFVVGWTTADARGGNQESLIALDTAGQVVTIEVLEQLDATGLISALARAGRHGDMKRGNLIDLFPGSAAEFASDWTSFLERSSTTVGRGPKLYLFIANLGDDVREPLAALSGLGVQAQQVILHEGAQGILVEVVDFEHNRPHLLGSVDQAPVIAAGRDEFKATDVPPVDAQRSAPAPSQAGTSAQTGALSQTSVFGESSAFGTSGETSAVGQTSACNECSATVETASPAELDVNPSVDEWGIEKADWEIGGWSALPVETPAKQRNSAIVLAERSAQAKRAAQTTHRTVEQTPVVASTPAEARAAQTPSVAPQPKANSVPELSAVSRLLNNRDHLFEKLAATPPVRTLYDDLIAATKPAEQRLWEMSAPSCNSQAMFISESRSAADSARAVAEAAEDIQPWERITRQESSALATNKRIIAAHGGEVSLTWRSLRRGIDIAATLTTDGYFTLADGRKFTDPAAAARALTDVGHLDAWRGWRTDSGTPLGDLR